MPNRYGSFKEKASEKERIGRCFINRVPVNSSKAGFIGQILRFVTYFWFVFRYSRKHKFKFVFATSGRMFTASTAIFVAKRQGIISYLDIRDIFLDTIDSVFINPLFKPIKFMFKIIEKYTFINATRVNLISPGFLPYFNDKYPQLKNIDLFTNGIDDKSEAVDLRHELPRKLNELFLNKNKKYLFYAGNIGESQGLEKLIPSLAKNIELDYDIIIVGDGNSRSKLENNLRENNIENVYLFPPVKRDAILESYKHVDVLFTNLAAVDAFEKVIPSKLFEYGATGLPIIAGLEGFPKSFVNKHIENCKVFKPSDSNDAHEKLKKIQIGNIPRERFCSEFSRNRIVEKMVEKIVEGIDFDNRK